MNLFHQRDTIHLLDLVVSKRWAKSGLRQYLIHMVGGVSYEQKGLIIISSGEKIVFGLEKVDRD